MLMGLCLKHQNQPFWNIRKPKWNLIHLHQLMLQVNLPNTFGGVAKYRFKYLMKFDEKEFNFITDKWVSPSIKDCDRDDIVSSTMSYQISGIGQTGCKHCEILASLIEFLSKTCSNGLFTDIFGEDQLLLNNENICKRYRSVGRRVLTEHANHLFLFSWRREHKDVYYLSTVTTGQNVILRTNDTECLVIRSAVMEKVTQGVNVWIEAGLRSKNTQRYISLNQLYVKLGRTLYKSLPGYNAFTGCDYTASFYRRGKVKPLKIPEKNEKY